MKSDTTHFTEALIDLVFRRSPNGLTTSASLQSQGAPPRYCTELLGTATRLNAVYASSTFAGR